eukprot:5555978-Pleurochrysis_carterae.AAC.2
MHDGRQVRCGHPTDWLVGVEKGGTVCTVRDVLVHAGFSRLLQPAGNRTDLLSERRRTLCLDPQQRDRHGYIGLGVVTARHEPRLGRQPRLTETSKPSATNSSVTRALERLSTAKVPQGLPGTLTCPRVRTMRPVAFGRR